MTRDHFTQPRRIGEMANPDGVGIYADPEGGDLFTVHLRVKRGRIADIRCRVLGCEGAVACASALSELALGKTLDDALQVRNEDVLLALGGEPGPGDACPSLGADALHRAVFDYLGRKLPAGGWTFWLQAIGEVTRVAEVSDQAPPGFPRLAEVSLYPRFVPALDGLEGVSHLWVSWWMHELAAGDRETLRAHPMGDPGQAERGVFALRSPARPNPIGLALVRLTARQDNRLLVDGLDARAGSPVIDLKPWSEKDQPPWR